MLGGPASSSGHNLKNADRGTDALHLVTAKPFLFMVDLNLEESQNERDAFKPAESGIGRRGRFGFCGYACCGIVSVLFHAKSRTVKGR